MELTQMKRFISVCAPESLVDPWQITSFLLPHLLTSRKDYSFLGAHLAGAGLQKMEWLYLREVIRDLSKKNSLLVLLVTFVWNVALNVHVQYAAVAIQTLSYSS